MSTNFEDLILRDIAANRPAFGIPGRLFFDTTNSKFQRDTGAAWEDCEGAGGAGDMLWADVQASQLVNEVKGWPPYRPNDLDLVTANLWWDDAGTPTTKATVVDVAGEGGITETYNLALKCVGDGAGDGLMQRYTYADEPRIKVGRKVSALVAIWSVGAINITAKLLNSDASETAAAAVSAAAWTIVEIPNHTLAGTYCDLQITAGAAGTFYVVPLGVCIGARGVPLGQRPSRFVDTDVNYVVNNADPANTNWTDVDCTSATSNLCWMTQLNGENAGTGSVLIRLNGTSDTGKLISSSSGPKAISFIQVVDDGQIFEYMASNAAVSGVYISVIGYWEWA